jgi:hypothetical protein
MIVVKEHVPMSRQVRIALVLGGLAIVGFDHEAEAGLFFHSDRGTPPPGHPRIIEHTHARAGNPLRISPHASPTDTPAYIGYYVGGGSACGGEPRRVEEGTWGRDYEGLWLPRHVWLGWSHGRRYQDGTGSYEPAGHYVPDVIALTIARFRGH